MININKSISAKRIMFALTFVSYLSVFATLACPDASRRFINNPTVQSSESNPAQIQTADSEKIPDSLGKYFSYISVTQWINSIIFWINLGFLLARSWNWKLFLHIALINPLIRAVIMIGLLILNSLTCIMNWPDWTFGFIHCISLLLVLTISYAASFGGIYPLSAWLAPPQPSSNS